jgi:polyribonucleotide nucleotidyltransferase
VFVASSSREAAEKALAIIEDLVREVEAGDVYVGTVTRLMNFGAFVEVLPGKEGLLHVSEISQRHVPKVDDVLNPGDTVLVLVKEIDDMGRINLSRKRILDKKDSLDESFRDALAKEMEREEEISKLPPESPGDKSSRDRDRNGGRRGGRSGQRPSRNPGQGRNR